ncbi:MAG: hypothetical protein WD602_04350 [Actinomycetota bacterium]
MVEIQEPEEGAPPGRSLAPTPSPEELSHLDLRDKLTSVAYALDALRRQADATTERTARTEGVVSALLGALESLRGDQHDLTSRTEQRVLRGLEFLDSRLAQSRDSGRLVEDLSDRFTSAVEDLKGETASSTARLELRLAEESKAAESTRNLIREHRDKLAESADALHASQAEALQELKKQLADTNKSLSERIEAVSESAARAGEESGEAREQIVSGLQRLAERLSDRIDSSAAQTQHNFADQLRDQGVDTEEALRRIEAELAAAAEREESTAQSTTAFQRDQQHALRAMETRLQDIQQTILKQLDGSGRAAAQAAEQSAKTLDQLIAALERMDGRFSHQVSSAEYALQGTLAEVERRLTAQVADAMQGIEARLRQREETLVRLIVAGSLENLESQ